MRTNTPVEIGSHGRHLLFYCYRVFYFSCALFRELTEAEHTSVRAVGKLKFGMYYTNVLYQRYKIRLVKRVHLQVDQSKRF